MDICGDIRLNLGLESRSLDEPYRWNEIKTIAFGIDDAQFKDFIDLMCQVFYNLKRHFD